MPVIKKHLWPRKISDLALQKLSNDDAIFFLAKGSSRAFKTVEKWIRVKKRERVNDKMLTSKAMVYLIMQVTNLLEHEIVELKVNALPMDLGLIDNRHLKRETA